MVTVDVVFLCQIVATFSIASLIYKAFEKKFPHLNLI